MGLPSHEIFASEPDSTSLPGPGDGTSSPIGTRAEWITEQPEALSSEKDALRKVTILTRPDGLKMYVDNNGIQRVYVPLGRRKALFTWFHESMCHLANDKVHHSLSKFYYWPGSRADCRRWYSECSFCNLAKAKRNLAHGRFRAVEGKPPRTRWQMDYYGVGDGYVLGLIDLDSLWVELTYHESRAASNVCGMIRDKVIFRHGVPDTIHSDHAQEFVGKAMTDLSHKYGYLNTSTGGYCPTGNSTIESFWRFLGLCIRSMSDEDYQFVDRHLQKMAWAWNTTLSDSLTCSPFEVMTGALPRGAAECAMRSPDDAVHDLDIAAIRDAAAQYREIAKVHGDYMRQVRSEHLNDHGRPLKPFMVGDHVKMYMPPSHEEAQRRKRKAKHIVQFRGPLRIEKVLSSSTYELKSFFPPHRVFRRHLSTIRQWIGPLPHISANVHGFAVPSTGTSDIQVGTFLVYREPPLVNDLYLAKVSEVVEDHILLWGWGSSQRNQLTATFKPMYTIDATDQLSVGRPREASTPYTWEMKHDTVHFRVPANGIELTSTGKLTLDSRGVVKQLAPAKLHRYV